MATKKSSGPSIIAQDPSGPFDIEVSTHAKDQRPITPDELAAHPKIGDLTATEYEFLADQIAERLVDILGGREPWRQEYVARVIGWGDVELTLPRYPIEEPIADADGYSVPEVGIERQGTGLSTLAALDTDTYRIRGRCSSVLYRDRGWLWTTLHTSGIRQDPMPGYETTDYKVGNEAGIGEAGSYTAGYVLPGQIGTSPEGPRLGAKGGTPVPWATGWVTGTLYEPGKSTAYGDDRGSWIIPSDRALAAQGILLECTSAGTTVAGSEPAWDTTIGAETVDGATFTTRKAHIMGPTARQALWILAPMVYQENQGNYCAGQDWMRVIKMLGKGCM